MNNIHIIYPLLPQAYSLIMRNGYSSVSQSERAYALRFIQLLRLLAKVYRFSRYPVELHQTREIAS